MLDFLGLPSDFSEAELEAAILRELEAFLLELGQGFSFIARQKRMSIGADELRLDGDRLVRTQPMGVAEPVETDRAASYCLLVEAVVASSASARRPRSRVGRGRS